ncbi:hypothetical protein DICVIV_02477 [Dictyocaulus viviparus]|uniref:AMP-dependent synthetase/ligase domain-containing protein n=1 Tax=Dictyocaulus viviparus TaxID=29172 RepID=A0A0D8Y3B9_DICVI|nr:hypothetical protein DICVIV_02477 [Dictyocaulus viviparus]
MAMIDYSSTPFHRQILEKSFEYGDTVALANHNGSLYPTLTNPQLSMVHTDSNGDVSYHDIYKLSHRFADFLHSIGLSKGDSILVLLPNSSWYAIVFLGAALIGCPLSGISHEATFGRIEF